MGSGVGLTAISLSYSKPKNIVLTDYLPTILHNCKINLELNHIPIENDIHQNGYHIEHLDWTETPKIPSNFDILLAADVIYDKPVIGPLTQTILHFMTPKTVMYMIMTLRNENTYEYFQKECLLRNLEIQDVTKEYQKMNLFLYPPNQIFILKITLV